MTALQDDFDVSHIHPDLRGKANDIKNRWLGFLGERGYQVIVERSLAPMEQFWIDHADEPGLFEAPNFAREFWPRAGAADTLLFFLEKDGRRVASCGYRRIELFDGRTMEPLSLREAFESLHYFYSDPVTMAPDDETCECRLDVAARIIDCTILVGGAFFMAPGHRGLDLGKALMRLTRIFVATMRDFHWSWMVTVFCPDNRELALEEFGFASYHPVPLIYRSDRWWLATMSREDATQIALAAAGVPLDAPFVWQ